MLVQAKYDAEEEFRTLAMMDGARRCFGVGLPPTPTGGRPLGAVLLQLVKRSLPRTQSLMAGFCTAGRASCVLVCVGLALSLAGVAGGEAMPETVAAPRPKAVRYAFYARYFEPSKAGRALGLSSLRMSGTGSFKIIPDSTLWVQGVLTGESISAGTSSISIAFHRPDGAVATTDLKVVVAGYTYQTDGFALVRLNAKVVRSGTECLRVGTRLHFFVSRGGGLPSRVSSNSFCELQSDAFGKRIKAVRITGPRRP